MASEEKATRPLTSPLVPDLAAVRTFITEMVAKGAIVALIEAILGLLTRMRDLNTDLVRQLAQSRRARPHSERASALQGELPFAKIVPMGYYDLNGRIEAYDISNISGTSATGSMVVFVDGKPSKDLYRKFKIRTVKGSNDFAMMEEVMRRRLSRLGQKGWDAPVVMVIDGGEGQVSVVQKVMDELGVRVPMIGIAKGFDRKQDRFVYDRGDVELHRLATRGKEIFQKARDEAHRFAVSYHRVLRAKRSLRGIL